MIQQTREGTEDGDRSLRNRDVTVALYTNRDKTMKSNTPTEIAVNCDLTVHLLFYREIVEEKWRYNIRDRDRDFRGKMNRDRTVEISIKLHKSART